MPVTEIQTANISRLEILAPDGTLDESLEPALDEATLVQMYRSMLLAREGDDRMLKLQRQGRVGTFAPGVGQEACVVGSASAMRDDDWYLSSFRELGGRLVRGDTLLNAYLYHNGYEEGSRRPGGDGRLPPINIIVGSQTVHAVGIGYAMKYRGEDAAVVVSLGDGATSEGDFHEALNFAGVWQTPVVFIIQNNQWAISLPRSKQTASETLAQKAVAYGIPGVQVDGNDILAMYKATKDALDRARAGEGPTLIEAVTYRLRMHTTADDPRKYRTDEETAEWEAKEPMLRFRAYLEKKGYWDDAKQEALEAEIKAEIEATVTEFENTTEFKPDTPFDHVFGTTHEVIEEQRAAFLADLEKESSDG